jgi:hypothetical protein
VVARIALVASAVALVAVATACGGGQSAHEQVATYLQTVNTTENKLAAPLKQVTKANQAFAKSQSSPAAQAQLLHAQKTMTTLERRLAAIKPPADARHLQALLLELVHREISLTQELYSLSTFVPRFEAALQPLPKAGTQLKDVLQRTAKGNAAVKRVDAEKAAELRSYVTTVDGVAAQLRTLHPPAVWRPTYENQLASLARLHVTGTALADAISANRAAAVPPLLQRFDAAAISDQSVAAQKQQIAAVQGYNRRVRSLTDLARSIDRERNRLQRVTT